MAGGGYFRLQRPRQVPMIKLRAIRSNRLVGI